VGVSPQTAKHKIILFLANVGVKENRKSHLCKSSGGNAKICEIEEPFSRAASTGARKDATREALQMKILGEAREERFIADNS
jgi:hypothetical protein